MQAYRRAQTVYSTRLYVIHTPYTIHTHNIHTTYTESSVVAACHISQCVMKHTENRQARVVLEDRMKYSLQLTALRLNPRRLRGVQALT